VVYAIQWEDTLGPECRGFTRTLTARYLDRVVLWLICLCSGLNAIDLFVGTMTLLLGDRVDACDLDLDLGELLDPILPTEWNTAHIPPGYRPHVETHTVASLRLSTERYVWKTRKTKTWARTPLDHALSLGGPDGMMNAVSFVFFGELT